MNKGGVIRVLEDLRLQITWWRRRYGEKWYETMGDPTLADAILDRLVHNAHKIVLKGESMRKMRRAVKK
jgi:hypothetical protein